MLYHIMPRSALSQSDLQLIQEVNRLEQWAMQQKPADCLKFTQTLRQELQKKKSPSLPNREQMARSLALCRAVASRILRERLYDVQLCGALALQRGQVVEMKTGEGKTLASVPAIYVNALSGQGVHVITVNDYLAARDSQWMGPIYRSLGLTVGTIVAQMENHSRLEAYTCDITYGTNNEFGFDYLRDNMAHSLEMKVQRGHHYCVIDEVDSVLIDEARTPLIISGAVGDDVSLYSLINRQVAKLTESPKDSTTNEYLEEDEELGDYKLDEKNRHVSFTNRGLEKIEKILNQEGIIRGSLFGSENFEHIHHLLQAVKAHKLFRIDRDYVVKEGQVQIVDEFTGRILHGRRYSDGLHQAIEAKEGIQVARRSRTLATITLQNYFRLYDKVAGMTGTAVTERKELAKIYGLEVVAIPTNRPVVREDEDDLIFADEKSKYNAIADEIAEVHRRGQPVLVGTVSIESSEKLSKILLKRGLAHEVLNAKNHAREALIVAEAGSRGAITIATNMAGRGTDIKLGGNPEYRARRNLSQNGSEEAWNRALQEEYQRWQGQYAEIQQAGGLYVIGTERHESRRIDNQLRGRSGRQGDPGHSRFFISMDDQLMRLFGKRRDYMKSIMSRSLGEHMAINHPIINKSIERAQTRVEERNFEIRKHLLEFDDVINEQRALIYQQRDAILQDDNLQKRLLDYAHGVVTHLLTPYTKSNDQEELHTALRAIGDQLMINRELLVPLAESAHQSSVAITPIMLALEHDMERKQQLVGDTRWNRAIRYEYIRSIDQKWQDHLDSLDALREAVYLRSYAQKNPLLEYKLEGFKMFDALFESIRNEVAQRFFGMRIKVVQDDLTAPQKPLQSALATHHRSFGQFGTLPAAAAVANAATTPQMARIPQPVSAGGAPTATIRQSTAKVGRNDPCPCGSGKKYKHCHGA